MTDYLKTSRADIARQAGPYTVEELSQIRFKVETGTWQDNATGIVPYGDVILRLLDMIQLSPNRGVNK